MAGDFVAIDVPDLPALRERLVNLDNAIASSAVVLEGALFLQNVLQEYPPYRHVSRRAVYGTPFQSDQQRRWFFAALAAGAISIPYRRTQTLARAWTVIGEGTTLILANETPYAPLMQGGPFEQGRAAAMEGWPTTDMTLEAHAAEFETILDAELAKYVDDGSSIQSAI